MMQIYINNKKAESCCIAIKLCGKIINQFVLFFIYVTHIMDVITYMRPILNTFTCSPLISYFSIEIFKTKKSVCYGGMIVINIKKHFDSNTISMQYYLKRKVMWRSNDIKKSYNMFNIHLWIQNVILLNSI